MSSTLKMHGAWDTVGRSGSLNGSRSLKDGEVRRAVDRTVRGAGSMCVDREGRKFPRTCFIYAAVARSKYENVLHHSFMFPLDQLLDDAVFQVYLYEAAANEAMDLCESLLQQEMLWFCHQ